MTQFNTKSEQKITPIQRRKTSIVISYFSAIKCQITSIKNILEEGNNSESTSRLKKLPKDGQTSIRKLLKEEQHNIKKKNLEKNEESSSNESSKEEFIDFTPT